MAKGVFLDRDGTLNPDPGYINDPDLLSFYPWVGAELSKLHEAGFLLFVVSNQSGVGRGLITQDQLRRVNEKVQDCLQQSAGIQFTEIANCPHRPDENCECRKPEPGLLLNLACKYHLDLSKSFMMGDRDSDVEAGQLAGCAKSFLLGHGDEQGFTQAIESILKSEKN